MLYNLPSYRQLPLFSELIIPYYIASAMIGLIIVMKTKKSISHLRILQHKANIP